MRRSHCRVTQAAAKLLVAHHLIPADDPEVTESDWRRAIAETWIGELAIARDGMKIDFGKAGA